MPTSTVKKPSTHAHIKLRPSAADRRNAETFDQVVASLFTPAELRPRRWLMRVSGLLGRVSETRPHSLEVTAERMGVSLPFVRRLVTGLISRRGPTASTLLAYAEAQGCDIEITMRTKEGQVLGTVSSADLDHDARELAT
jgi:transcriptional regulator with XRE-family HTH domain